MIANPKWFRRRSYTGWGFTPASWQGWAYIALLFIFVMVIPFLPVSGSVKLTLQIAFAVIFSIDAIDIMLRLKKDERETIHEALAERNAAWLMVVVLIIGLAYQTASQNLDPFLIAVLVAGVIAKSLTNWYLRDK